LDAAAEVCLVSVFLRVYRGVSLALTFN